MVLELSPRSEGEDPDLIIRAVRKTLKSPDVDVFVPALVTEFGGDRTVHWLTQGYAFVREGLKDSAYMKLEGTRYVQSVLSHMAAGKRQVALVPNTDIERMRRQLRKEVHQGIGMGDRVLITTGPYANVEATVIEEFPKTRQVQVHVKLRSKETLIMIPRSGLKVIDHAPLSPVYSRVMALQTWVQMARVPLTWKGDFSPVEQAFERYEKLQLWSSKGRKLYAFIASLTTSDLAHRLEELEIDADEIVQIECWDERYRNLWYFVASYYGAAGEKRLQEIESLWLKVLWLDDVTQRVNKLRRKVEAIGHAAAKRRKPGGKKVIQNLLVDGYNAAFRAFHAPGLKELKDSHGRPTGMIVGFFNILSKLRKRCPEARLYVAWDGTSARRRKEYPEYKANRKATVGYIHWPAVFDPEAIAAMPPVEGFDPLVYLMRTLTLLGVRQVYNPQEEADDVIGSLVHGALSEQHNLIYSSDRDFLQLVSETTMLLTPGAGSRKEILFDPALVKKTFGVPPETMVQLRAFFGDTSDNLPGVPRVPKKVLKSLVQAYDTVDGVYNSGLTGLSKAQYERLRSAEPQVRINVKLMRLQDVPVSHQDPDTDADAAARRLQELDISPAQIIRTCLGVGHQETADA